MIDGPTSIVYAYTSLRAKDLTHEMLKDRGICLRQVPSLHYLCSPAWQPPLPQAFCDIGREPDGAELDLCRRPNIGR